MSIKDSKEIEKINLAGKICCYIERILIDKIEKYIESGDKGIKHTDISQKIKEILENDNEAQKLEKRCKIDPGCVEFTYDPII